ncbi:MAG: type I 3-dehydroquinate dehydratase [Elusimicrobiota bacterium]
MNKFLLKHAKLKPKIAVVISDKEANNTIKKLSGIDILEIRVDQFKKLNLEYITDIVKIRKQTGLPLILTVRSKEEGGEKKITDTVKLEIFKRAIRLVDVVDIELKSDIISAVVKLAKKNKKTVIVSFHNFKKTPVKKVLTGIVKKAKKLGADIVKIATQANKPDDVVNLMEFTRKYKAQNLITISLGKTGNISRLISPLFGSLIVYSYINKPYGTGQLPLTVLQDHLRLYYH